MKLKIIELFERNGDPRYCMGAHTHIHTQTHARMHGKAQRCYGQTGRQFSESEMN